MRTGECIKELRKKSKLTQKQLAEKIHVSSQVVSNWERGYSTPDSEDLKKIAESLDTSTDYLLGRTDNPDSSNNKKESKDSPSSGDEAEFEAWVNDPKVDKFYKEFKESPEERKKALLAVWEILKTQGN